MSPYRYIVYDFIYTESGDLADKKIEYIIKTNSRYELKIWMDLNGVKIGKRTRNIPEDWSLFELEYK